MLQNMFTSRSSKLMSSRQSDDESGEGYDVNHYDRLTGEITVFIVICFFSRFGSVFPEAKIQG